MARDPEALALRVEYLAGKSFRAVVLGSDEALRRGVRGGWKLLKRRRESWTPLRA